MILTDIESIALHMLHAMISSGNEAGITTTDEAEADRQRQKIALEYSRRAFILANAFTKLVEARREQDRRRERKQQKRK